MFFWALLHADGTPPSAPREAVGYRPLRASQGEKTPLPAGLGFRWKNLKKEGGFAAQRCFSARSCTAEIRFCGRSGLGAKPWVTSQRKKKNQKLLGGFRLGGFGWKTGEKRVGRCRGGELLRVQFGEVLSLGCAGAADRLLT